MNDELNNTLLARIRAELANNLGLDPEDIATDDTFLNDLHMRATEFSDFLEELNEKGIVTTNLDLTSINTVGDLVEALSSHEYFD
jgi:acyl carrier protein